MLRYVGYVAVIFIITGCSQVSFLPTSVPEEGGARFTKLTENEDGVRPPLTNGNVLAQVEIFDVTKDGSRLAFMGWKNSKGNIYVKDLRGGRATLQRTFRDNILGVAFSQDGENIAFSDFRDGSWNIYMMGALSGSAIRQVTTSPAQEEYPIFLPDGKTLLFCQSEVQYDQNRAINKNYIWSYDLTVGTLTQYSQGFAPTVGPDKNLILVVRYNQESGHNELWQLNLQNGQEFLIASSKERGFFMPALSPDGKKIAYCSNTTRQSSGGGVFSGALGTMTSSRNFDIYIINIDGTNPTQITFHPGNDICPKWSPDGKSVYFLSQRGSQKAEYNIWKMDLN